MKLCDDLCDKIILQVFILFDHGTVEGEFLHFGSDRTNGSVNQAAGLLCSFHPTDIFFVIVFHCFFPPQNDKKKRTEKRKKKRKEKICKWFDLLMESLCVIACIYDWIDTICNNEIVTDALQTATAFYWSIVYAFPVNFVQVTALSTQIRSIYVIIVHQMNATLTTYDEHMANF